MARDDVRPEHDTEVARGLDRAEALRYSLLSTHLVARAPTAAASPRPLEAKGCEQSTPGRCWPREADDAVLGAAIMLPDHPQIAPESRGNLFDSTEIEEALLLHVLALSDEEREQTRSRTRPCAQMLERAARTTPEELMACTAA